MAFHRSLILETVDNGWSSQFTTLFVLGVCLLVNFKGIKVARQFRKDWGRGDFQRVTPPNLTASQILAFHVKRAGLPILTSSALMLIGIYMTIAWSLTEGGTDPTPMSLYVLFALVCTAISVVVSASIVLFNQPKCLIPKWARNEAGLLAG